MSRYFSEKQKFSLSNKLSEPFETAAVTFYGSCLSAKQNG